MPSPTPRATVREFISRHYWESSQNLRVIPDATFEELRKLTIDDDALLGVCGTLDQYAAVEATRRLRDTLHKEEVAIKRLTWALVGMTAGLLVMTAVLIRLTVLLLKHGA